MTPPGFPAALFFPTGMGFGREPFGGKALCKLREDGREPEISVVVWMKNVEREDCHAIDSRNLLVFRAGHGAGVLDGTSGVASGSGRSRRDRFPRRRRSPGGGSFQDAGVPRGEGRPANARGLRRVPRGGDGQDPVDERPRPAPARLADGPGGRGSGRVGLGDRAGGPGHPDPAHPDAREQTSRRSLKKGLPLLGAALLLGGAFFFGGGCAGTTAPGGTGSADFPPAVIPGVPFLPQEEDTCGPSSLAMVLRFLGSDVSTPELVRETRTEGLKGTLITDLAGAARRRGFSADVVDLDLPRLRERITAGNPVILLVDLGVWAWSRPHYLVAYGWTPEGVVAHSGLEKGKVIPFSTLDAQWIKMGRMALLVRR
ncbi:MAG: peptidase C39 family protein, partial [Deltaproteobacteria bacterium]|nr:peptidase C39 family protein [Deltaproteobacteria bacterium]